ncbi:hypothetical protein D3C80_1224820 [compost metagenome]
MSSDNSSNPPVRTMAFESAQIERIEAWLIAEGWSVNRFDTTLTPSCAEVNYRTKTFRSNISSAYYCAQVFERVENNLKTTGVTTVGGYMYVFSGGETHRRHDGGDLYQHKALSIHPVELPRQKAVLADELKD